MKKISLALLLIFCTLALFFIKNLSQKTITGAPPYDPGGGNVSPNSDFSWLNNWKRPEGGPTVALQVGHWKNEEVPEELKRLRGNTGASGGGKDEWEVNYEIAQATAKNLREKRIKVEVLPATIPPKYWADVFVAIHADGSLEPEKSGYKVASPRRDYIGNSKQLVKFIETSYQEATGLEQDPNITRNMTGYYAFSWWRYEHAVHPMTASAILETGFLTNWSDQQLLIYSPEIPAQGLADGIESYLKSKDLLK